MPTDRVPALIEPTLLRGYDRFARAMGATELYWRLVAQAAIRPGSTVLEIGCGTGNVLIRAARTVPDATAIGLDPDPSALAIARGKAGAEGLQLRLDVGSATALPYPDGGVDRVLSSLMLHHLTADEQVTALREARRVLAPGGSLHLVDLDEDPRDGGRVGRVFSLVRRLGGGHAGHVHGERDHGHGAGRPVGEVLAEAGFETPVVVGPGRTRMGGVTFHRASR